MSIDSSGTSIPAFRAASRPTSTAPLTEVSASVASGEYRQAPSGFFFCEVIAAADGQLQRLADRPRRPCRRARGSARRRRRRPRPGRAWRSRGGTCSCPMMPVRGVLGRDDVPERPADVVAVEPEVGVLARGEEGHQGQAGRRPAPARPPPVQSPFSVCVAARYCRPRSYISRTSRGTTSPDSSPGAGPAGEAQGEEQGADQATIRPRSRWHVGRYGESASGAPSQWLVRDHGPGLSLG